MITRLSTVVTIDLYTTSSITKMTTIETSAIVAMLLWPTMLVSAFSTVLPATYALTPGGAGVLSTILRTAATDS